MLVAEEHRELAEVAATRGTRQPRARPGVEEADGTDVGQQHGAHRSHARALEAGTPSVLASRPERPPQLASLDLGQATPDADEPGVAERLLEALLAHRAPPAQRLGPGDLRLIGSEEQRRLIGALGEDSELVKHSDRA